MTRDASMDSSKATTDINVPKNRYQDKIPCKLQLAEFHLRSGGGGGGGEVQGKLPPPPPPPQAVADLRGSSIVLKVRKNPPFAKKTIESECAWLGVTMQLTTTIKRTPSLRFPDPPLPKCPNSPPPSDYELQSEFPTN